MIKFRAIVINFLLIQLFGGLNLSLLSAQSYKTLYFHRAEERKGSSVSLIVRMKGQDIATVKNGETVGVYTYENEFQKIDVQVMDRNGVSYTAGDVSVENFFLQIEEQEHHIELIFESQGRDIKIMLQNRASNPYPNNTVRYIKELSPGANQFMATNELKIEEFSRNNEIESESKEKVSPSQTKEKENSSAIATIKMIQPQVAQKEVLNYHDDKLTVKGQVLGEENISQILINGQKANLKNDGFFELEIKIPYTTYEININVFYENGRYENFNFSTKRPFGEKEQLENPEFRKGKDYALIFATNEYNEIQDLTNPVFDAQTIAEELKSTYGFEVETVINPTINDIYSKLKLYAKRLYGEDDQLFIFFAGHGEYDNYFKEGYVLASDSKAKDEGRSSYISHSNLRTIINNIPAKHIMLTMDVCFGGTFDPLIASRGSNQYQAVERDDFIKRKMEHKTRLYLTSGGKTYVPDGRPGHHSPFARRFLEALRSMGGTDGILTYKEILSMVEKVNPEPRYGEFGSNEPGSDFLFIYK